MAGVSLWFFHAEDGWGNQHDGFINQDFCDKWSRLHSMTLKIDGIGQWLDRGTEMTFGFVPGCEVVLTRRHYIE